MIREITSIGELAKAVQAVMTEDNTPSASMSGRVVRGAAKPAGRDGTIWFRGQLRGLPLLPTIYREGVDSRFERELIRDLKLTAVRLLDKPPRDEWEWLFIARHHGFVSRLLDWSESPLIALYFVLREEQTDPPVDCVLWTLNPYRLNQFALSACPSENTGGYRHVSIPVAGHPSTRRYLLPAAKDDEALDWRAEDKLPRYPIAIRAPQLTPRSVAQRGVFTVHGHEKFPLEKVDEVIASEAAPVLRQFVVPSAARQDFLDEFHAVGITESMLFPDLEGVIRNLHEVYSSHVRK